MKLVVLFVVGLLLAGVSAQTDQDLEDACECAAGPNGDGMPPYECGHVCPSSYQCHLSDGLCTDPEQTCTLVGSTYQCACATVCQSCGQVACGQVCTVGCAAGEECKEEAGVYQCKPCECTQCGSTVCGEVCKTGCPAGEQCLEVNGIYSCEALCTPSCDGKKCGESDGCTGRCAEGSCTKNKEVCGGAGVPFECGKPKKKTNWFVAIFIWIFVALFGGGAGAAAIVVVVKRRRKALVPTEVAAKGVAPDEQGMVEVETGSGSLDS